MSIVTSALTSTTMTSIIAIIARVIASASRMNKILRVAVTVASCLY